MAAGDATVSGTYLISDTTAIAAHLNAQTNLDTGSMAFIRSGSQDNIITIVTVEGA